MPHNPREPYHYHMSYPHKQKDPVEFDIRKSKTRWPERFLLVGAGLIISTGIYRLTFSDHAQASTTPPPSSVAKTTQPLINTSSLGPAMNSIISNYPGLQIGVSVINLNTGEKFNYGVQDPYIGASVSKLITASLYLHNVEDGNASLLDTINDQPAKYKLQQMIEQSDNDAWVAFNSILGHDNLQNYAQQIGLQNYNATDNTVTPSDVALLLQQLYTGKLLSKTNTQLLLSYMQNANEADYIPAAVPSGVKVYHKAGYLDDRAHDAAIIDNGQNPYILVVFTKSSDAYDFQQGIQLFHQITGATTSVFNR